MTNKQLKIYLEEYQQKVFQIAFFYVKDKELAKDITQEVFIKLWETTVNFEKIKSKLNFLYTITKNKCLDILRNQRKIIPLEDNHKTETSTFDHIETISIIMEIYKELPQKQKLIFYLRDIQEYSNKDIEEITGDNVESIRMNLSRARKFVRTKLEKIYNYGL